MNNELLLLNKIHRDTLIVQTKPQWPLEFVMSRQMEIFSFNPPKNFAEEGKGILAVTSFEATNSIFEITDGKNL